MTCKLSSVTISAIVFYISLVIASASATKLENMMVVTNLENMMVVRYIDISTQLVIINSHIKVLNNNTDPIDNYAYIVDPDWTENLSFIEALDKKKNKLTINRSYNTGNLGEAQVLYNIIFPDPLLSGETATFIVSLIITNHLKSYPKSVKQNEKHMVMFSFNVYYHSMYVTQSQTTYLYMGTTKAAQIDGAKYKIANDSEYGLRYGPFYEVGPFENKQSVFHYENNSPFLVANKVTRYLKISHWGFLSVWDQVQLFHSGPKFKGPFKRGYFNNKRNAPTDTRVEQFDTTLPDTAFDIYLKDEIGQITSYQVNYDDPYGVIVSIQPRNVLYGGWKTEYEIGYSVPISEFVTVNGSDEYILNFPLIDKIFNNMIVNEVEINIILPEGSVFSAMDPKFKLENRTTKYCYYFDVSCRDVITIKGYNLVERHIVYFSVTYTFLQFTLLVKPMVIAMGLFFIFILLKIFSIPQSKIPSQTKDQIRPVRSNESFNTSVIKKKSKQKIKHK